MFVPQQQITHRINRVKNAIRHPPLHTFPSSSRGLKRLRKRGAGEAARRVVDNVVENSTKRAGPEVCSQYCSGETMPTAALFSPLYPTDSPEISAPE